MGKRGLYTLEEWDRLAQAGEVFEPKKSYVFPGTGISCPNFLGTYSRVCGAHLYDSYDQGGEPFKVQELLKARIAVWCPVCGWPGSRAIGKTK